MIEEKSVVFAIIIACTYMISAISDSLNTIIIADTPQWHNNVIKGLTMMSYICNSICAASTIDHLSSQTVCHHSEALGLYQ